MPLAKDPLTDWSSHVFVFDRKQYLLVCNTQSFYSVLLLGAGISDPKTLVHRAMISVSRSMEQGRMGRAYLTRVAPAIESVQVAKSLNRAVTGSMNDLIHLSQWHMESGDSLEQIETRLNDTFFSALQKLEGPRSSRPASVMWFMADSEGV